MSVRLSELVAKTRTVEATAAGVTITVTYKLGERTLARMRDDESPWWSLIESWDITDDNDAPVPLSEEGIDSVPLLFLNAISRAIYGDDGVGEAESS